jgi:hypothetical protein
MRPGGQDPCSTADQQARAVALTRLDRETPMKLEVGKMEARNVRCLETPGRLVVLVSDEPARPDARGASIWSVYLPQSWKLRIRLEAIDRLESEAALDRALTAKEILDAVLATVDRAVASNPDLLQRPIIPGVTGEYFVRSIEMLAAAGQVQGLRPERLPRVLPRIH